MFHARRVEVRLIVFDAFLCKVKRITTKLMYAVANESYD